MEGEKGAGRKKGRREKCSLIILNWGKEEKIKEEEGMSRREEEHNEIRKKDKNHPLLLLESCTGVRGVWTRGKVIWGLFGVLFYT